MAQLVGFRFCPTKEEIVNHYLWHMNFGNRTLATNVINEIQICEFEPWELPAQSKIQADDDDDEQNAWYFFYLSELRSTSSKRAMRKTKNGYWKTTGRDRQIRVDNEVIGTKKTLVFYKGQNPRGEKTSWVMHEYHPSVTPSNKRAYVLCKLKNKVVEKNLVPSSDEVEAIHPSSPDSENHASVEATSEVIVQGEESVCDFVVLDDCLDIQSDEDDKAISRSDSMHPIDSSYNPIAVPSQEISQLGLQRLDGLNEQGDEFVNSMSTEEKTPLRFRAPSPRFYHENITKIEAEAFDLWVNLLLSNIFCRRMFLPRIDNVGFHL